MMNRSDRRTALRMQGHKPDEIRAARRAERVAQKLEAKVLKMTPAEARRLLAEWAAQKGRSGADVDLLNKVAGR